MSQGQTVTGVGRLYKGQRGLGCVAYWLSITSSGQATTVRFDPVPDGTQGAIFSLHLADGRILECQAAEGCRSFLVMGQGPHPERRASQRPPSGARLLT